MTVPFLPLSPSPNTTYDVYLSYRVDSGFGLSLSLRSQGLKGKRLHDKVDGDEWTKMVIREPRLVEVVLEAAEENGQVEVVIGMIAVVNSLMMQSHGVQIEGFSVNAFRN